MDRGERDFGGASWGGGEAEEEAAAAMSRTGEGKKGALLLGERGGDEGEKAVTCGGR